ncbi:MAG TPA: endonuclease III [Candidatus Binatia bacterium]|nr:endonuclease III [Candidatus Binatia bacterium]
MPGRKPFVFASGVRLAQSGSGKATGSRQWKRETLAQKSVRTHSIAARLARIYPELEVPLRHRNTFELLIAVILSAQCTDEAVNRVTPELFRRYPDPETLAHASTADIERIIRTLGLFRAKAKSLKECARQLVEDFGGAVPAKMEELTRLAGVGRKTANVILGHAFATPGIIVDTHCKRLSRRLGLTRQEDPTKIERDLSRLLPAKEWTGLSHRLIIHGRRVCYARKPACDRCVLNDLCPSKEA